MANLQPPTAGSFMEMLGFGDACAMLDDLGAKVPTEEPENLIEN
jgi:hypothetical protein